MKVVGILGGMGPQATIDLYQKIINLTPASRDQEHLQVLIWSNPKIPDRTEAILFGGEDPTPALVQGAELLEKGGVDFIAIPCNTAHLFAPAIQSSVSVPLLNMIEMTSTIIAQVVSPHTTVGIMATNGTVKTELYQEALQDRGLNSCLPDAEYQALLMDTIFDGNGIKAGFVDQNNQTRVLSVINHLRDKGAGAFIAGCTELPLVLAGLDMENLFDPTAILAQAVVAFAQTPAE